ncbi:hypothetical protein [Legionella sp.]|uniref:hypothetical protein n=1 Tax=Legionella sp. TaxID=459 RepID=UPI003C8D21B6
MRIIVVFSNHERYVPRVRVGDICIIVRDEEGTIKIKFKSICVGLEINRMPLLQSIESIDEIINVNQKINVEIIGHSSKGGKSLQSDVAKYYPLQNIALDDLTLWIEQDLLKHNVSRSTISFLSCEAADGKKGYPSVAEQAFALFNLKPQKLTARMGYGYIAKNVYSLGTFDMVVKTAVDRKNYEKETESSIENIVFSALRIYNKFFKYSTVTKVNEKFVYFMGQDKNTYKIDKQVYDVFHLIKNLNIQANNTNIAEIIKKDIENVSSNEFQTLAKYAICIEQNEKLQSKSYLVSNGNIKSAEQVNTDLNDYDLKRALLAKIETLKNNIGINRNIKNTDSLNNLLGKTRDFIRYRHPRNYLIDNLSKLVNTFIAIIENDGELNSNHIKKLAEFSKQIKSGTQIEIDSSYRANAVGIRLPVYYASIRKVTETKNKEFSIQIDDFLTKILGSRKDILVAEENVSQIAMKNYSFVLKAGSLFGIGIAGSLATFALINLIKDPSFSNKFILGTSVVTGLSSYGLYRIIENKVEDSDLSKTSANDCIDRRSLGG